MKTPHTFTPSEHKIQSQLIDFLRRWARPDCHYFAVPNQSNRHIANAAKMKAEGVRAGVADLCFMLPGGRVGWLEMKKPGGRQSPAQRQFAAKCAALSHPYALAWSLDEAIAVLRGWGVIKDRSPIFTTNHLATTQRQPKEQSYGTQA